MLLIAPTPYRIVDKTAALLLYFADCERVLEKSTQIHHRSTDIYADTKAI